MPLHLIIDGYNLLGARGMRVGVGGPALEAGREGLLAELAVYRQRRGHPVTVVFDGWQHGTGAEGHEFRSGVEVIYSRRGETADQVIQRLAATFGRDCAVVSSDHEVAGQARATGAVVLTAREFDARLREARERVLVQGVPRGGRASSVPGKDADRLPDRRGGHRDKKGNPRKLPKAVRKRLRQLRQF